MQEGVRNKIQAFQLEKHLSCKSCPRDIDPLKDWDLAITLKITSPQPHFIATSMMLLDFIFIIVIQQWIVDYRWKTWQAHSGKLKVKGRQKHGHQRNLRSFIHIGRANIIHSPALSQIDIKPHTQCICISVLITSCNILIFHKEL